jgi:hypothetical protein
MSVNTFPKQLIKVIIKNVILILHNDKSSGLDNVTNEYLKDTVYFMIPIHSKLFNFIFDKGVVPVSWCVGAIAHIFRSKGSSKEKTIQYIP